MKTFCITMPGRTYQGESWMTPLGKVVGGSELHNPLAGNPCPTKSMGTGLLQPWMRSGEGCLTRRGITIDPVSSPMWS